MTTLTRFAPTARRTIIRAGMLARDYGRGRLSTEFFLLALAEDQPLSTPVDLGITAAMIRAEIKARMPARQDRDLLAALGIDLDESGRKVIEVAQWVSRRGCRTLVDREDLLWGLLADGSSESVRFLRRTGVNLGRLWTDLQRWHRAV